MQARIITKLKLERTISQFNFYFTLQIVYTLYIDTNAIVGIDW